MRATTRAIRLALVAALLASGCVGAGSDRDTAPPAIGASTPHEIVAGHEAWVLDSPGDDSEAAVAVHPTDPRRIAVAWVRDYGEAWVAVTTDSGQTWRAGAVDPDRGTSVSPHYAPDGALFVVYRGAPIRTAVSRDDGASWSNVPIPAAREDGLPEDWESPDLAIVPATGALVVAAAGNFGRAMGVWTSADGKTWSGPRLMQGPATVMGGSQPLLPAYWPRLVAGEDERVLFTMRGYDGTRAIYLSEDAGRSFTLATSVVGGEGRDGRPGAISPSGALLHAAFVVEDGALLATTSTDGGATFLPPQREVLAPGRVIHWAANAARDDGRVETLFSHVDAETSDWAVGMAVRGPGETPRVTPLVPPSGRAPPASDASPQIDEDFVGGIAIAPDGATWLAWADPRGPTSRVLVLRLAEGVPG